MCNQDCLSRQPDVLRYYYPLKSTIRGRLKTLVIPYKSRLSLFLGFSSQPSCSFFMLASLSNTLITSFKPTTDSTRALLSFGRSVLRSIFCSLRSVGLHYSPSCASQSDPAAAELLGEVSEACSKDGGSELLKGGELILEARKATETATTR